MPDDSVQCPNCGHANPVSPQRTGWSTITCASCGQPFPVGPPAAAAVPPAMPAAPPYAPPGVQPTPLGYGVPPPATNTKKILLIVLVCVLGLGVIMCGCMVSILLPSLTRAREQANRVKCASNMRQVGQAIMMYANANKGKFPDAIEKVILSGDVDSSVFACPSSSDTAAPGADFKTQAANLHKGGHLSYVYVGKGMDYRATQDMVLLYEPLTNHNNDGINVLFGDGHVEFIPRTQAQKMIADVQAGTNPPTSRQPNY